MTRIECKTLEQIQTFPAEDWEQLLTPLRGLQKGRQCLGSEAVTRRVGASTRRWQLHLLEGFTDVSLMRRERVFGCVSECMYVLEKLYIHRT